MIKKTLIALSFGLLLSLTPDGYKPQKENVYTLTEGQVILLSNAVSVSKQIFPTSQAPAIQVTQLNNSFDSIMNVLIKQYQSFHPDTTSKKK